MTLTKIIAASAVIALVGTSAFAGETVKTTIKPLTAVKSTQAPVSLGLGGLGAGGVAALVVVGGIIAIGSISSGTSGT